MLVLCVYVILHRHPLAGMTTRQEQAFANLVRVQALVSEHIRSVHVSVLSCSGVPWRHRN